MTSFEWFLLIVVVIVVPLTIAVVVTLWTIDQANKRKRANRKDAQIGVKRKAALSPEEAAARKAARAERMQESDPAAAPVVSPGISEAIARSDDAPVPDPAAALDESLADSAATAPDPHTLALPETESGEQLMDSVRGAADSSDEAR